MLEVIIFGVDLGYLVEKGLFLLISLMFADVVSGLLKAGKQRKINSTINLDGLLKKLGVLVGVIVVNLFDSHFGFEGKVLGIGITLLIIYELNSIIENLGVVGVNIHFLTKYYDEKKVGRVEDDEKDIS